MSRMIPPRVLPILLAVVLLAPAVACPQEDAASAVRDAMKAASEGRLLRAISLFESRTEDRDAFRDILGALYSFAGEWEKADELRPPAAREYEVTLPPDCRLTDALEAIAVEAHGRQLVIINEAHDAPEHRAFISKLVEILRQDGFSYYAMETLVEDPRVLSQRGYPVRSTGFYSVEPRYGELIREALRCGFTPVSYEAEPVAGAGNPLERMNAREASQCRNLVERVFSKHPDTRVLVHVGLSHVMEEPKKVGGSEIQWLAARLKQATGIDPLTIDQISHLRPPADGHARPAVAVDPRGRPFVGGPYQGYVDLQVYHPPTTSRRGRPSWLLGDERRRVVDIPDEIEGGSTRVLVQAYYAHEVDDAVPADQVLLVPNRPRPVLSLRPGSYRIVSQDERGELSAARSLIVQ